MVAVLYCAVQRYRAKVFGQRPRANSMTGTPEQSAPADQLLTALLDRPGDPMALVRLAQCHLADRAWDRAEPLLWRAFAAAPSHPFVLSHLSATYTGRGDGETARALARSVLGVVLPEVAPGPPGAPTVLVLHATGDQPFKPAADGSATMAVGTNLHSFVDPARFRIVRAFAENLVGRPEAWAVLGQIDAVLNLSVDEAAYGRQFSMIQAVVDRLGVPVVNPPALCAGLGRADNYRRLHDIDGLVFPRTARIPAAELADAPIVAAGFDYPVILRNTVDHFGGDAVLARGPGDLEAFRARVPTDEVYVIQYIDNRIERPGADPVWRRLRLAFFGGSPVPVNVHFDTGWNVHGRNRDLLMPPGSPAFEEERAFVADWQSFVGPVAGAALLEIARRTPVDYVGIDFTVLPDGRALVFEVNPAMALLTEHARTAPHLRTSIARYREALTALLLRRIADGPAVARS